MSFQQETRPTSARPVGNATDSGPAASRRKKEKANFRKSTLFEPLVEIRGVETRAISVLESGASSNLKDQLSKSQRKSQKLNLIRENPNGFNPNLNIHTDTPSTVVRSVQNETLLKIYTDSGTFSKVVAMTVAASVLDTKFPYDVIQNSLDHKNKEELQKFCSMVNFTLGLPDNKNLDINDYRRLWHLYTIFTTGMEQHARINASRVNEAQSSIKDVLQNSPYSTNADENPHKGAYRGISSPRRRLEETTSDSEIIENIKPLNRNLYQALRDPLGRFLIVFGRYLEMGHIRRSQNMKYNSLNAHILKYLENVGYISVQPALINSSSLVKQPIGSKGNSSNVLTNQREKHNAIRDTKMRFNLSSKHQSIPDSPSTASNSTTDNSFIFDSTLSLGNKLQMDEAGNMIPDYSAERSACNYQESTENEQRSSEQIITADSDRECYAVKNSNRKGPTWAQTYCRSKTVCLEGCRYDVVRRIALEIGFKEVDEHSFWNIIWTDVPISLEKALDMRRFQNSHASLWGPSSPVQKANHFPGMNEICRKDRLARNLNRMRKCFPEDYNFFPRTWSLPSDMADLLMYSRLKKNATYICKPDSGCQGKGIFLARNVKKLSPFAKLICQVYIPKPLLIDGYKFDLRIYILITSCDPLRVFIYNEGIARFATIKYCAPSNSNVDMIYMHLTNYSINKFSQSYSGDGSKRKMSAVFKILADNNFDTKKLQDSIDAVVVKTLIAAQPTLRHYYRASFPKQDYGSSCFEILGFDILIDRTLKPFLLEVNHSPSFNLDLPVDAAVKENLLRDTFNIIFMGKSTPAASSSKGKSQMSPVKSAVSNGPRSGQTKLTEVAHRFSKALQLQIQHEATHIGNFRLIYPVEATTVYNGFFDQSACPGLINETYGCKNSKSS